MRPHSLRKIFAALAAAACLVPPATAEDLDLFTTPAPVTAADAPNILIILDNSANWARNDQGWPIGKQGESELKALRDLMADPAIGTNVNIGLMMFTSGAPDGAYVRFHLRNMTPGAKSAFVEMIGTPTCTDGPNSLTGGANCILKNFNSASEKTNSASTLYSSAFFEAFKYFGGWTDPSNANTNLSPNPPNIRDSTHFGTRRHSALDPNADRNAFTDGTRTVYAPPIALPPALPGCGKNYIVFIGNGYPSQDTNVSVLAGIFGDNAVPAPIGNKANRAANWTKYINLTDVAEATGKQNIRTYTIDVYKDKFDANQTNLMRAMAKFGGGKYFEAKSETAIINALRDIIVEIQAVNSVFASASLPINATNRSQNENQVFIGMFRPDADALPRWYGNLKQFKIGIFGGDAKMADKNDQEAIAASTGFIQACATSFWTTNSDNNYWSFSPPSAGTCSSVANSTYNDLPDGGVVEKGGTAEVVRKGNNPSAAAPFLGVNRTMLTCAAFGCSGGLVSVTDTMPPASRTGAVDAAEQTAIINHALGLDVNNEDGDESPAGTPFTNEPRPSIHGDIAHSRPLPVNFTIVPPPPAVAPPSKVVVYYGANDGVFRAVEGHQTTGGRELWSFIAPEHHGKLKRLYKNDPVISYPIPANPPTALRKDYFFDGSAGLYQNGDNSKVWIFPTMRRGGRSIYAFDVSGATSNVNAQPNWLWSAGCPNLTDDTGCQGATGTGIGQTWSNPQPAFIKGYMNGDEPVIIMGGGYDACEDVDAAVTTCTGLAKGRKIYVLDARTGDELQTFTTDRPVAADVTLIDRDFDGKVDHAYAATTGGGIYRIDFVDPQSSPSPLYTTKAKGSWEINKVAETTAGNRKFLFGAAALVANTHVFLAIGTGDRERPLITNYPYTTPIMNRFYMFTDKFVAPIPTTVNLDGGSMANYTSNTTCITELAGGQNGWFMDLTAGTGEQVVTSSVIFGGTVFFSTNRPIATVPGTCASNLGEARGYAVNLLNASGVIGTGRLCGGSRSGVFTGGGLPPSPVVGSVPVTTGGITRMISVLIGGINLQTGGGSVIGAQEPPIPISQIRSRIYWYPQGDR